MKGRALYGRRRVKFLPMAATATPVSAATEQEHYHNDNQDQFHGNSPLMAMAFFAAYQSIQQRLQSIVPDKPATPQFAFRGCEQLRSVFTHPSSPKFNSAMQLCYDRVLSWRRFQRATVWQIRTAPGF
jgi:hypothetical protein